MNENGADGEPGAFKSYYNARGRKTQVRVARRKNRVFLVPKNARNIAKYGLL